MRRVRHCRKPGCERPAVATLTSVYADSTIVLGPLATEAQPEAYDLCEKHVSSFTAPRGWQIIRLATEFEPAPPSEDDLLALADAVREASRAPRPVASPAEHRPRPGGIMPASLTAPLPPPQEVAEDEILRRGHLRVLRGQKDDA
ncbi:DUF3499 domain-containing protein [Actinomyces johnsonii]|uniref:DUF3499 domain-containing protein n=1 Tax=Actinomyces johnsonii TaxID=544581 RepID=A0A508AC54_9ACTO|nr:MULTISPECIES: DUF3499 domain-containing protein [Actinomyces]KAA8741772.1 DUF3499 domain-containing protein [Actinomyces johnsonii]TQD43402.1 DUF3499 domain-containing protein [Actinomyces johnsonii]